MTDATGDGSTGSDSPTGSTVCWTVSDTNGTDPPEPNAGGDGGGGASFASQPGRGGPASTALDGASGDAVQHGGGGGGGGSPGNIRVASATPLAGMQISPPAIALATLTRQPHLLRRRSSTAPA